MWDPMRLKSSGRTMRMFHEAVRLACEGKAVYVVMSSHDRAEDAQREIDLLKWSAGIAKKPWPKAAGPAVVDTGPGFDWKAMRILGTTRDVVVLIDHHLLELKFAAVLEMLRRFDPPEVP